MEHKGEVQTRGDLFSSSIEEAIVGGVDGAIE